MAKNKKTIPFEKAFQRLEEIVQELEKGGDDLETSLELFEEGVKLTEICRKVLEEANQKIKRLVTQTDGELTIEELD